MPDSHRTLRCATVLAASLLAVALAGCGSSNDGDTNDADMHGGRHSQTGDHQVVGQREHLTPRLWPGGDLRELPVQRRVTQFVTGEKR